MNDDLYFNILKKLYEHMVGGVAAPLGADASGEIKYADEKTTDKKFRNKSKKRKEVQTVLKSN